jgi:putative transcriptional regulator
MSKRFLNKIRTLMGNETMPSDAPIALNARTYASPQILDASGTQGYLAGQLLVATPLINQGCFQKSVVFVFAHNEDGAMGVIINQPLELVHFASLIEGMDLPPGAGNKEIPVYYGGPVERARGFVVHSTDYHKDFTLVAHNDVAITASSAVLADIVAGVGPEKSALIVGYAGWDAGQLEAEIEQNSWIHVPATGKLVFDTENEMKWAMASKSLGVDMNFFSMAVGHA